MRSLLFPLLYILFSNATTVHLTKKSFIKSLPFTLLLIPFSLFFSGIIFSTFKIGVIIDLLYALISIILTITSIKNNKFNEFKNNYFSYGLIAFLITYLFVFIYSFKRTFYAWDEISHWGLMLKEMFRLDNFYSINESTLLVHKDYPPIIQLYELFWIKLCGSFKEYYPIRALQTFCISLLLPFLHLDNPIEKLNSDSIYKYTVLYSKTFIFIFIIILTLLLFDTHIILNTIYIDYTLSILIVYAILLILFEKDKISNFIIINLSILSAFILLTKQVALSFYLMILFFYILSVIKNKKLNRIKIIEIILLLVIIPLLTMVTWNKYINQFNIYKQFVISDIQINELPNIITNKDNIKNIIVYKFKDAIINKNISNIRYGKITYLYSYIIYTLLSFILLFFLKDIRKKDFIKYYLTLTIGYVGYAVMMLILYLFCFKEEGYTLASFDRYMVTYILIAFISLIIIIIENIKIKDNLKMYLLIITILIISINGNIFTRIVPRLKESDRSNTEIGLISNYIINNTEENARIFFLSQNTLYNTIQIFSNYYINPRKANIEPTKFDTNCNDCENTNMKEYLEDYDYIYIYSVTDELYKKYPSLKDLKLKQLYKIIDKNEKIKFIKVNN